MDRSHLARAAIVQVIDDWAMWRDTGRWNRLRETFTPEATMCTTWFVGAASEFIDRSIAAAKLGARAQHFIGSKTIEIAGDRAVAETRMMLLLRATVHKVEVDVTCYGRFYDQFLQCKDRWSIYRRVPIYEKDRLDPVDPATRVELDLVRLASHPEGYRHIAYVQREAGAQITPSLPTPNSCELADLYAEGEAWLNEAPALGALPKSQKGMR
jgi:SnoaL-like domain